MNLVTRSEPAPRPRSYAGLWLVGLFALLFYGAHKADQYPIKQREERERQGS